MIKVLTKWKPNLDKPIDDLLLDWFMEVTKFIPFVDFEIVSRIMRDPAYNRVLLCKDVAFEIRPPSSNDYNPDFHTDRDYDREWHDDGLMYPYIIQWASADPSLIRANNNTSKVFRFEANDIYIMNNRMYQHRRSDLILRERFFARALIRVDVGEHFA